MSERWSERRAYAAWIVVALLSWCAIVVSGLMAWSHGR